MFLLHSQYLALLFNLLAVRLPISFATGTQFACMYAWDLHDKSASHITYLLMILYVFHFFHHYTEKGLNMMNHLFVSFTLIKPDRMVTLTSICFWMSQCCFLIKMFMIMKHTIWTMLPVVVSVEQYLIVLQHGPCYLVQSMSGYVLRSICRKTNSNQFTWISFPLILARLFQWLPLLKLSRRQDRSKRFLL